MWHPAPKRSHSHPVTDKYFGNVTNETIFDEAGNDEYKMGGGNDDVIFDASGIQSGVSNIFDGEAGTDSIDFSVVAAGTNAIVNLSVATAQTLNFCGITTQTNTLKNFENVYAGAGNETIVGSALANDIQGGDDNDKITGGGAGKTSSKVAQATTHSSIRWPLTRPSALRTSSSILVMGMTVSNLHLSLAP